jgi:hypothetical protein
VTFGPYQSLGESHPSHASAHTVAGAEAGSGAPSLYLVQRVKCVYVLFGTWETFCFLYSISLVNIN